MITAIMIIGAPFSILAAAMAFIITHEEYRHHFRDRKKVLKQAFSTALITFAVFVLLLLFFSLVIRYFL